MKVVFPVQLNALVCISTKEKEAGDNSQQIWLSALLSGRQGA